VGTCGALDPALELGELVIASEATCADGASRALAAGSPVAASPRVAADRALTESLIGACPRARAGAVLSVDLFYDDTGRHRVDRDERADDHYGELEIAIEMEAATLFALGASLGVSVACMLAVTDTFTAGEARDRLDDHGLLEAAERMGTAAVAALTA
jgi:uridine phosphorylase